MKNEKANVRCGSKRYVCSVYAKTKSYKAYLGYYSYFECDCGYSRRESQYGDDYRCYEQDKNGKVLSRTENNPFTHVALPSPLSLSVSWEAATNALRSNSFSTHSPFSK